MYALPQYRDLWFATDVYSRLERYRYTSSQQMVIMGSGHSIYAEPILICYHCCKNMAGKNDRCTCAVADLHAGEHSIVLVDSTRSGKKMPDALSKTVPTWCAVVNRAICLKYPTARQMCKDWDNELYTPPGSVSSSEHAQIECRLDAWAQDLFVGAATPSIGC